MVCPCCLLAEEDLDHPIAFSSSAATHRSLFARAGLQCSPCSAVPVQDQDASQRNVIANGLTRFEIGSAAPKQEDLERLSDRVICILGQNPSKYTLNGTNCYLVGTGQKRLLIDTGDHYVGSDAFMNLLADCMEEQGVTGLDGILITHMHHDHNGNIGKLMRRYGPVPVYAQNMSVDDFTVINEVRQRGLERLFLDESGAPRYNPKAGTAPPMLPTDLDLDWAKDLVSSFGGTKLGARLQWTFFFQWHHLQLAEKLRSGEYPWHPLVDGDVIRTEGATLEVLHTPGHAPDHMSFLLAEEHALFSGDHVLGWGTTLVVNMRDYMATLKRMFALKPTRLYPGHGGYIQDGVDVLVRYIAHRESRAEQAWEALERKTRPVPVMEVARELYPNTPESRMWMAKDNVEKLFRMFADDSAAGAWVVSTDAVGVESFLPASVPSPYKVGRLQDGFLWAARRTLACNQGGAPSKL